MSQITVRRWYESRRGWGNVTFPSALAAAQYILKTGSRTLFLYDNYVQQVIDTLQEREAKEKALGMTYVRGEDDEPNDEPYIPNSQLDYYN